MKYVTAALSSFVIVVPALAHHGSGISCDMEKPWTTKAAITECAYSLHRNSLHRLLRR
jgi:hypothetical protein